jgi:hypothetical protein
MKKAMMVAMAGLLIGTSAYAQQIAAPEIKEGDQWVYSVTNETNKNGTMASTVEKWENLVVRIGSRDLALASKRTDSNLPPKEYRRNIDWSSEENVDGKMTVTNLPYSFPLTTGKKWSVEYTKHNVNAKVKSEKIVKNYVVLGPQDITTPAGTFHAIKVEINIDWSQEFNEVPASASASAQNGNTGAVGVTAVTKAFTPPPVSGRNYEALWYVPEVKKHVKLISESYQAGGQLSSRITEILDSSSLK